MSSCRSPAPSVPLTVVLVPLLAACATPGERDIATDSLVLDLRIGAVEGETSLQFDRIGGIHVFEDGAIAVLDGSAEVRVFSRDGRFLRRFGREGDGPGEWRPLAYVAPGIGRLAVIGQAARAEVFDSSGVYIATLPLRAEAGPRWRLLREVRGGWLADMNLPTDAEAEPGTVQEVVRAIHRLHPATGRPVDEALRWVVERRIVDEAMSLPPLFSGHASVGVDSAGRIYVTDVEGYRVGIHDPDGRLIRTVEPTYTPRPITDADRDRYASRVREFFTRARPPDWETQMRRTIDDRLGREQADHAPVTGELLVAESGAFWVERIDLAGAPAVWELRRSMRQALPPEQQEVSSHWERFDASGQRLGRVILPARFHPLHVTETEVTGVLRDELGVEYVARYTVADRP